MALGRDSGSRRLGPVRKFVSPSPRVISGAVIGQAVLFLVAVGIGVALLLSDSGPGRSRVFLSRGADWAAPFALLVVGELVRRWTNRRLMSLHERGVAYMEQRTLRTIAWEEIERAQLGPGTCRLRLRGGEEIDLPAPLAANPEVREALQRAPSS